MPEPPATRNRERERQYGLKVRFRAILHEVVTAATPTRSSTVTVWVPNALFKDWLTRQQGVTDADGRSLDGAEAMAAATVSVPLKQRQERIRDEAAPRRRHVAIPMPMLIAAQEAQRLHEVQCYYL